MYIKQLIILQLNFKMDEHLSELYEDPNDPFVTCPYDEVHRLRRSYMPRHLIKCKENFPLKKFKTCPFNAIHLVEPVEFEVDFLIKILLIKK